MNAITPPPPPAGQRPPAPTAGVKHDADKVRVDLLPVDALTAVSQVLTYGSSKYGPRNWEQGMNWSRLYGALLRHVFAWWRGQNKDPETGYLHLAHAACCILFALSYQLRNAGTDDRPKTEALVELSSQ